MKKKSLAEKMAEKTFHSAQFQQSWAVHMGAFGPILEPAFADDCQSRVHLTAALNLISNRKIRQGLDKLKSLQSRCLTDADRTAVLFFMGVGCEMAGDQDQMFLLYTYANAYGHKFYLPYLKAAKYAHQHSDYVTAEENFRAGIACFDGRGLSDGDKVILGSAYTNLASTLTMMRRFDQAEAALATSRSLCPQADGRASAEAILYAAQGLREKTEERLSALTGQGLAYTREVTDRLLKGEDPRFKAEPVAREKVEAFWTWFAGAEAGLAHQLENNRHSQALSAIGEHLMPLFPFLEQPPEIGIGCEDGRFTVDLMDFCHATLEAGYQTLLENAPEGLDRWTFRVIH